MNNQPRPRIAILHYAAPPTIGGVESTIAAHARLFADHGYKVKIIAGRGEQFDSRVPVELIPTIDSRHSLVTEVNQKLSSGIVTSDFHALTAAIRHALHNALADVDVCIAHNTMTLHKNLALTNALYEIAQAQRTRLIAWSHDLAWDDPIYTDDLYAGLPWDLLRQPWQGVRYVVVSTSRKRDLLSLWGRQASAITVVPPGVDIIEFLGITLTTVDAVKQFDLLTAAPLLLLPARVTRRKNIELAIQITAQVSKQGLTPKLVVMGPLGPHNPTNAAYLDELRALRHKLGVDDAVVFLQEQCQVDDAMRRDLYLLADALLLPSIREGFGIPILEAGLVRLPIFCADIPPFRESARDNAHYFSVDESPATIAARIKSILSNDLRYRIKKRVLQEFTWERIFAESIRPLVDHMSIQ